MEALRLSRQDDPFLKVNQSLRLSIIVLLRFEYLPCFGSIYSFQVLASRESLADSNVAESDHEGGPGVTPVSHRAL